MQTRKKIEDTFPLEIPFVLCAIEKNFYVIKWQFFTAVLLLLKDLFFELYHAGEKGLLSFKYVNKEAFKPTIRSKLYFKFSVKFLLIV